VIIQSLLTWFALGYGLIICLTLLGSKSTNWTPAELESRKTANSVLICIAMGPLVLFAVLWTLFREEKE